MDELDYLHRKIYGAKVRCETSRGFSAAAEVLLQFAFDRTSSHVLCALCMVINDSVSHRQLIHRLTEVVPQQT